MKNETWKDIEGYEGIYQISNTGRVKSYDKIYTFTANRSGIIYSCTVLRRGRILKLRHDKDNYPRVGLYNKKNYQKWHSVHRLVLNAFAGPCPDNMEACHNDGDPTNNNVDNLRWDTHINNMVDRDKHHNSICKQLQKVGV